MKKTALGLICVVVCLVAFGQMDSTFKTHGKKDSTHFVKYSGFALVFGSPASPTGIFGMYWPLLLSSKHFDLSGGIGWCDVTKVNLGIGYHPDMRRQFCPFFSIEPVFSFKKSNIEFGDNPERHYKVSSSTSLNYSGGMMWQPKSLQDPKLILSVFIKAGYRQLISDYSIKPADNNNSTYKDADMNSLYHELFESRFYWNIGIRISGLLPN